MRAAASAASGESSIPSSRTANSSPPKRATVSDGRTASTSRCADLAENEVAGGMAETVVDHLEIVQVDEEHADRRLVARRARQCVLHAVGEQRAVGELRDRIMEGLVGQLVFKCLALAHITAVEDDAAYVLVIQEIGVLHLEMQQSAVAMSQRAFDRVRLPARAAVTAYHLCQPSLVGRTHEPVEPRALDVLDAVAEQSLHRRALVGDDTVVVEHADQVARVCDERPEPSLALPTVQITGQ